MSRYLLVIIKKEVALQYYRKEDKLFRLFQDYVQAYEWARPVLEKQIRYITEPISIQNKSSELLTCLNTHEYIPYNNHPCSYISTKNSSKIEWNEMFMKFENAGTWKEEWAVFDCLKNQSPYFFAMNMDKKLYGWLKPLKVFSVL
ncbi:sporulation inhibitor of replication protein SirA [Alteribacillus sp. HJP-4]|uniref:sporulation inhibitor of replication protein SirA n=1 Tax=Alteribacillus sp. HJP-4 TaxID=2775394 RepID=UPI0035CD1A47